MNLIIRRKICLSVRAHHSDVSEGQHVVRDLGLQERAVGQEDRHREDQQRGQEIHLQ